MTKWADFMEDTRREANGDSGRVPPPIDPTSSRGDDGGMSNERIAKIETRLDHIESTLVEIKAALSNQKWQLLAAVLTIALAVWGSGIAIQSMTVSTFQGAAQQAANQPTPPPNIIINVPSSAAPPASTASR